MEKIKDSLKDGAVVTVQKEKGNKIIAMKNSIGTQTKLHDKQATLKTTNKHREEQSIELWAMK